MSYRALIQISTQTSDRCDYDLDFYTARLDDDFENVEKLVTQAVKLAYPRSPTDARSAVLRYFDEDNACRLVKQDWTDTEHAARWANTWGDQHWKVQISGDPSINSLVVNVFCYSGNDGEQMDYYKRVAYHVEY